MRRTRSSNALSRAFMPSARWSGRRRRPGSARLRQSGACQPRGSSERVSLTDRTEVERPGPVAEAARRNRVLRLENSLARLDEGTEAPTLVVLEALLDYREVEGADKPARLLGAVLERDRHPALVHLARDPAVEAKLVGGGQLEAGVVAVA